MAKDVEERRPYQTALLELKGRVEMEQANGSAVEIATAVADRIMEAENLDEVMAIPEAGPGGLDDLVGKAFRFIGGQLRWAASAEQFRDGGTGFYAVFSVLDMNDVEHMVSTGSVNVVFQLRKMEKLGIFDNPGELTEKHFTVKTRPTANGSLYWLTYA